MEHEQFYLAFGHILVIFSIFFKQTSGRCGGVTIPLLFGGYIGGWMRQTPTTLRKTPLLASLVEEKISGTGAEASLATRIGCNKRQTEERLFHPHHSDHQDRSSPKAAKQTGWEDTAALARPEKWERMRKNAKRARMIKRVCSSY